MVGHDLLSVLEEQKKLIGELSPKFADLSFDFDEILEKSTDPKFVALLLFKLAQERERSNRVLDLINEKFDKIMFELKTSQVKVPENGLQANIGVSSENVFEVLPEQDLAILQFVEKEGKATAFDIQKFLNYKGINAASQRLNKLFREGYLKKVQAGKKVLFLAKN